jgi:hypothetical protein
MKNFYKYKSFSGKSERKKEEVCIQLYTKEQGLGGSL